MNRVAEDLEKQLPVRKTMVNTKVRRGKYQQEYQRKFKATGHRTRKIAEDKLVEKLQFAQNGNMARSFF